MSAQKLTVPAFAKINLGLRVLGRRPDGYHEIITIFQTVSLHDTLIFETAPAGRLELVCTDPEIPTDETNLALRAASALRQRFGAAAGAPSAP